MPLQETDTVVVGLGAIGSFACLELARRGVRVIGLDQHAPPHDFGSHSGQTRVFRLVCGEGPEYCVLAARALTLWNKWGATAGAPLFVRDGLLRLGPPDHPVLEGTRRAAAVAGVALEELAAREIRRRFPAFAAPASVVGLSDPTAGRLDAGRAIGFANTYAKELGADIRLGTAVQAWEPAGSGVEVMTSSGGMRARRLILAPGAWAPSVLGALSLPLALQRRVMLWVRPAEPGPFEAGRMPIFAWAGRSLYGFPNHDGGGVKVAFHDSPTPIVVDAPETDESAAESEEARLLLERVVESMPRAADSLSAAKAQVLRRKSCLYTLTPDRSSVVDFVPGEPAVVYAAGFSGHGFKFAPAIGEALAEAVVEGAIPDRIAFLARGCRF